jgi:spore germination protein KA
MNQVLQISEAEKTDSLEAIVEAISYGDTVLFADGANEALLLNTKQFVTRSITEPENEKVLAGPKEGFNELLMPNLSLIRRKVCTNDLKMRMLSLGKRTRTKACVCYMEGLVNKALLDELMGRLKKIDIDGVLDTNYITELIKDNHWSPFRTTGYTEKPDVVIGKLLEGRIAIFLDGSPDVITVPYLFIENFQSSEDYYLNFYYTSFSRLLRILGFIMTVIVPGLYVATVAFHREMLPTSLFINIAMERQRVPFPAALEAFIMLVVFDILRETGARMPSNIGTALSIVGALVIGQAAVTANLVSAPMIIVVGMTGITNLLVPKMNAPIIYLRMGLLLLSSFIGYYGLMLGMACILIHIFNLRSLGIPQITLTDQFKYQSMKDTMIRGPWWKMIRRSKKMAVDEIRMKVPDGDAND